MMQGRREPGEQIGPFRIERYLASGGMGDVYVARRTDREEAPVALKLLGDATPDTIDRFTREARIASRLSHPRIVGVRAHAALEDGTHYIAMDLLQGSDLDTRIHKTALTLEETLLVAEQVCDALEYAHGQRVIHRDLKPQNIYLCAGSNIDVKVLDFGIARLLDDRGLTATGSFVGTLAYVSPEQVQGARDVDGRADLWSLGVVLYQCLTGHMPFAADSPAAMLCKILLENPEPMDRFVPTLPRPLVHIVDRLLKRTRQERFPDASALRSALLEVRERLSAEAKAAALATSQPHGEVGTAATVATNVDLVFKASGTNADPWHIERRPLSVVFLREVRDEWLVQNLARQLQGHPLELASGGLLIAFGIDRWQGDEPLRAVRLAAAAALSARSIGVATGKAQQQGARPVGYAIEQAVSLTRNDGVHLDASTAEFVGTAFRLQRTEQGATLLPNTGSAVVKDTPFDTPFEGRALELSLLLETAETATNQQQVRGLILCGASGMGKSRLRHEAITQLQQRYPDLTVLLARCEPFRENAPFSVLRDALLDAVDPALIDGIFPTSGSESDPLARMDCLQSSIETILDGFAAQSSLVLLVIDDAQWMDPPSAKLLARLCERAQELPLAVWLCTRPEGLARTREVLPAAPVRELTFLPKDASEKILRAVAGTASNTVLERAAGHPLFLIELGQLLAKSPSKETVEASLPLSIEGALLAQIDTLESSERDFLKRAAVLGRRAAMDGVLALGAEADAFQGLRKANLLLSVKARGVGVRRQEFSFCSALLQEVAYGLWTESQRTQLHGTAARWLATREEATPGELALHWELAGETALAANAYVQAAEASAQASDAATTCALVDSALKLTEDPALRWRALIAQDAALQPGSDRTRQAAGLEQIETLAATLGGAAQAEAAWRRCYFARSTGALAEALEHGRRAITLAEENQVPRWACAAWVELAFLLYNQGRLAEADEHAIRGAALAERIADAWLAARAEHARGVILSDCNSLRKALEFSERAAEGYARSGDKRREASTLSNAGFALLRMGRTGEALQHFEAAIQLARQVGSANTIAIATGNRGTLRRMLRDFRHAEEDLRSASEEAKRLRHGPLIADTSVELRYLALASDAPKERFLALDANATTASSSELSAALRVRARLGLSVTELEALARKEELNTHSLDAEVELRVALYEACGKTPELLAAAQQAFTRYVTTMADGEDAQTCARGLMQRYLVPEAVAAILTASPA